MKKHRVARVNRAMFISAAALACCAGLLSAGSLTPPAGPIGGSFKTLGEVEPRIALSSTSTPGDADSVYRITAPGSYYLVGSVAAPSGKTGIEIACDGVTVDLNGFVLTGVTGSLDGLRVTGNNRRNIEIRNGTIVSTGPSAAVIGDSSAGCLGAADPNANFTH